MSGIVGSHENLTTHWRSVWAASQSRWSIPRLYQQSASCSLSTHLIRHLLSSLWHTLVIPVVRSDFLTCWFDQHLPAINDVMHLYSHNLSLCVFIYRSFSLTICSLIELQLFSYNPCTSSVSERWFTKLSYLFTFLMVYFKIQKCFLFFVFFSLDHICRMLFFPLALYFTVF